MIAALQSIRDIGSLARWSCSGLLSLTALGYVICGVFTLESALYLHQAGSMLLFAGPGLGFVTTGLVLRRVPEMRSFGSWLILGSLTTAMLVVLFFLTFDRAAAAAGHGVAGLIERVMGYEISAWYVALGWLALRRSQRPAPR